MLLGSFSEKGCRAKFAIRKHELVPQVALYTFFLPGVVSGNIVQRLPKSRSRRGKAGRGKEGSLEGGGGERAGDALRGQRVVSRGPVQRTSVQGLCATVLLVGRSRLNNAGVGGTLLKQHELLRRREPPRGHAPLTGSGTAK